MWQYYAYYVSWTGIIVSLALLVLSIFQWINFNQIYSTVGLILSGALLAYLNYGANNF